MEEQLPGSADTKRIDAAASPATRPFDLPRDKQPRRRSSLVGLAALGFLLAILAALADVTNVGWNVTRTTTTTEQFATRNVVIEIGSGTITLMGSDAPDTTVDMTRQGWGGRHGLLGVRWNVRSQRSPKTATRCISPRRRVRRGCLGDARRPWMCA